MTTAEEHRALRESLGALALGHLDAAEAAEVGRHVAGCPSCRHELESITPVAVRLRQVDWSRVDEAALPAPDLGERIVAAVRRERGARAAEARFRRVAAGLAAAAAVVAVCGVGAVAGRTSSPRVVAGPKAPVEAVEVRSADPAVVASAGVVPHTWGVEIKLRAAGFTPGAAYSVYVTTADGRRRPAGAFVGTGAKTMDCNLNSDVLRPDAAAFAVVDDAGRTVLSGTLPAQA